MMKFLLTLLAFCALVLAFEVDIRHENKLLGSCLDAMESRYNDIANMEFAQKYHFEKFEVEDEYNLNTNITGYSQKEYCGIGVQLCYDLNGSWHNFKLCNVY
ncbi:unnamed protein product [Cunninghamella blakesleeana]